MFFSVFLDLINIVNESGKFIGNFQKIISFYPHKQLQKQTEFSERELLRFREKILDELKIEILDRKSVLPQLESDLPKRGESFLSEQIKIDLEIEEQNYQVRKETPSAIPQDLKRNHNPLKQAFGYLRRTNTQAIEESPQTIIDFFDHNQGKLLILGEPGGGKTIELVSLAEGLIERAIADEQAPIPIIFELSTWKSDRLIRDWLIEQFSKIYKSVPQVVAKQWIDNNKIIPLLDGLNESKNQNDCIVELNQFLGNTLQIKLVVCCQREAYEQSRTQAQIKLEKLRGAIYLKLLSNDKIWQYLQSLRHSIIWENTIVNQPKLLDLCRIPLFLRMFIVTDQRRAITKTSELFEDYIDKHSFEDYIDKHSMELC